MSGNKTSPDSPEVHFVALNHNLFSELTLLTFMLTIPLLYGSIEPPLTPRFSFAWFFFFFFFNIFVLIHKTPLYHFFSLKSTCLKSQVIQSYSFPQAEPC